MFFDKKSDWYPLLKVELESDYMRDLEKFLKSERILGKIIYPSEENIFKAFQLTKLQDLKVVILGQDPYHGVGQAHGLAFSVGEGIKPPPSLKNIFKECESDLGISMRSREGDLSSWARQGVLLLNTLLTVENGKPLSHLNKGWEKLTDSIMRIFGSKNALVGHPLVFILWGKNASEKLHFIDDQYHQVITAPHPSPFSAHRGFFGHRPFSRANAFLKEHKLVQISWN